MLDIHDFYDKMERDNIMLSFKGEVTPDLLASVLQIMESKMDNIDESPKIRRKVFNILVECLQNLFHHMDEMPVVEGQEEKKRKAIFMIGKVDEQYKIISGNYLFKENMEILKGKIDKVNSLDKPELKKFYQETLNNGQMSAKGGGGLGLIDIARKSGNKLDYTFAPVNDKFSFFTLTILI